MTESSTWKTSLSFLQGPKGAHRSVPPGTSAEILWSCSSSRAVTVWLCRAGTAWQELPPAGKTTPFGEETLAEHRAQHCYPWISTKHGPASAFATSLINAMISALPTTPKNKADLFFFFQLWLIIKCEPCTKLSSVLGSVIMKPVTPNTGR